MWLPLRIYSIRVDCNLGSAQSFSATQLLQQAHTLPRPMQNSSGKPRNNGGIDGLQQQFGSRNLSQQEIRIQHKNCCRQRKGLLIQGKVLEPFQEKFEII